MLKAHERKERLNAMSEEERREEEQRYEEMRKKHAEHPKVNHPVRPGRNPLTQIEITSFPEVGVRRTKKLFVDGKNNGANKRFYLNGNGRLVKTE